MFNGLFMGPEEVHLLYSVLDACLLACRGEIKNAKMEAEVQCQTKNSFPEYVTTFQVREDTH